MLFRSMRLERYLVQVTACGIEPIIVLNKADLVEDTEPYSIQISKLGRNCPVYFCSTYNQTGITFLNKTVSEKNKTYILIGSSGVGKSSLLNALMENVERETGNISHSTGKGRHITTSRDLYRLPHGGLIIDTPGMREFGIAFDQTNASYALFPLIDELAKNCRYSDCQHQEEDGCAVIDAFTLGKLEPDVYQSYLKLIKEQKHFEIKTEDKKRMGKQFGKMIKEVRQYRKKYKY